MVCWEVHVENGGWMLMFGLDIGNDGWGFDA